MTDIERLIGRLNKIGITLELIGNVPWIYLRSVNGNKVKEEDWDANYGYTIAWYGVRIGQESHLSDDLAETFRIIRKYR